MGGETIMNSIYNMLFNLYNGYLNKNTTIPAVMMQIYKRLIVTDKVFLQAVTEYQNQYGAFKTVEEKTTFTYIYFLDKMQTGV